VSNKRAVWQLYLTATATGQRPSALVNVADAWAALQFDNAVVLVGRVIENAAQEQHNAGNEQKPRWVNKYEMEQLLDPDFRLPRVLTAKEREQASINALKTIARGKRSNVRHVKVKG
jgi:hypothetical protein